jgi:hypothetical protein
LAYFQHQTLYEFVNLTGELLMKRYALILAGCLAGSAQAWDCKYEQEVDLTLDLSDSDQLFVIAGAGDLDIRGDASLTEARVRGKICSSEEDWLADTSVVTSGGENAEIAVVMPDVDWSWSKGNQYVYIDLEIDVPDDIPLDIKDSSGDLGARGVASIRVKDSSGDIELEDVTGSVYLEDSSGDIELEDIVGDVTVGHDSSGDIYGRGVQGSVLVAKDSSGDIRFKEVRDDFTVERDSSGDIVADTVGGDFRVLKDGSGDISHKSVSGEVDIPDKG